MWPPFLSTWVSSEYVLSIVFNGIHLDLEILSVLDYLHREQIAEAYAKGCTTCEVVRKSHTEKKTFDYSCQNRTKLLMIQWSHKSILSCQSYLRMLIWKESFAYYSRDFLVIETFRSMFTTNVKLWFEVRSLPLTMRM